MPDVALIESGLRLQAACATCRPMGLPPNSSQPAVTLVQARLNAGNPRLSTQLLDRIGIVLSLICAAHCMLTPLLVVAAPFFFSSEFEHQTKAVLATVAVVALAVGYASHRSWKPVPWLALALGAFAVEHALPFLWWELSAAVLGSGALIVAHLANTRACKASASHVH